MSADVAGREKKRPRVFTARRAAWLLSLVLLVYLLLLGRRALTLIMSGQLVPILLGLALLVLPVLAVLLVLDQLRFGQRTENLGRRLASEGELPDVSHLPRRPSGRVERAAADEWFEEKQAELEQRPDDWRAWFALAQAYDLAGDRNRGRKAMRKAIELESGENA